MNERSLSYRQMTATLGVSRTQIMRWVRVGKLPQPIRLGGHRSSRPVWWEHEVVAAMNAMDNRSRRPE